MSDKTNARAIFGETVRNKRLDKNIGLNNFAKMVGVSAPFISKMEVGDWNAPSEATIIKIAEILEMDKDELLALAGKVGSDLQNRVIDNILNTEGELLLTQFIRDKLFSIKYKILHNVSVFVINYSKLEGHIRWLANNIKSRKFYDDNPQYIYRKFIPSSPNLSQEEIECEYQEWSKHKIMPKGKKGTKMVDPHKYYTENDSIVNVVKDSGIRQYLSVKELTFIDNLSKERNAFLHEAYGILSTHYDDNMPLYWVTVFATDEATEFLQKKLLNKLLNKICNLCADRDNAMEIMKKVEILVTQQK